MPITSKSGFATMLGRSPAAVSQWIAAGKLHGLALVGEGRSAQIDTEVALAQLGFLDLGQQLAQPQPIISGERRSPDASAPEDAAAAGNQARLLKARADREELALQVDQAKAAGQAGHWMVTEEAEAAWSAYLATLVNSIETWLLTSAAAECAVAAANGGTREIGRVLKDGFRQLRQRLAEGAARRDHEAMDDEECME